MNTAVKANNYLANSRHIFDRRHITLAKKIHLEIEQSSWEQLGKLLLSLSSSDKEMIHYAFYDLYGYDYELKIRSAIGSYSELRKYGLL